MSDEISREENLNGLVKQFKEHMLGHYIIAKDVLDKFSQEIWDNPKKALDNFFISYNQALDKAYTNQETGENFRCLVEMMTGGPHEAIPSALYNSVGIIYPFLDREMKNYALEKILGILDQQNNRIIQISHTPYIRDPLLLSDISIARSSYWPGLDEGERLIKKKSIFLDFKSEFIDEKGIFNKENIDSDFIVGYSLLRKDICDWGEEYIKVVNKSFLDRVLKGIVGMRFAHLFSIKNLSDEEIEGINEKAGNPNFYNSIREKLNKNLNTEILNRKNRLQELLPVSLHSEIEKKFKEQDWADYKLFMRHKNYLLKARIDDFLE